MLGKRKKVEMFDVFNIIPLVIFGGFCLYPFIYMLALSLNEGTDTLRGGITLFPRSFTIVNYLYVLQNKTLINAFVVSILRTVIGTASSLFVTALAAYSLSERGLPGKKYIMIYMLIPMLFSGGLIPTFLNLRNLKLINTFFVYIIPALFSVWNCIIMRTSFSGIHESLKENARIYGGNEWFIFTRVILPLSKPLLAALALFISVGHWNDWFTGAFFVHKQSLIPVQTILQMTMNTNLIDISSDMIDHSMEIQGSFFDYSTVTSFSLKMATVIVGTAPILILYPFLQKYFVKGVLIGSLKE